MEVVNYTLDNINQAIISNFGNKLRLRVCGICIENSKLLLVNHKSLNKSGNFLAPPGGGLAFGESIYDCLKREFKEETGLAIEVFEFLFFNEFLEPPLHAVELFFKVNIIGGRLKKGIDPELSSDNQIIMNIDWYSKAKLLKLPADNLHQSIIKNIKLIQI